jgi:hypothetical protein
LGRGTGRTGPGGGYEVYQNGSDRYEISSGVKNQLARWKLSNRALFAGVGPDDFAAAIASLGISAGAAVAAGKVKRVGGGINDPNGRKLNNSKWEEMELPTSAQLPGKPTIVKFGPDGYPDFSPWASSTQTVGRSALNGDYNHDAAAANKAAGFGVTPPNMVWHHLPDCATLILIPKSVHDAARHSGGSSLIKSGKC